MANSLVVQTSQNANTCKSKKVMLQRHNQLVKSVLNVVVSYCSEIKMAIHSSHVATSQNAAIQEKLRPPIPHQSWKKKNASKIAQIAMATWSRKKEDSVTSLAVSIIQSAITWKK